MSYSTRIMAPDTLSLSASDSSLRLPTLAERPPYRQTHELSIALDGTHSTTIVRLSIKKKLFPVQRVATIEASRAAAIFFFFSTLFFFLTIILSFFGIFFFFFANMKKKVSSRTFF